MSSIIAFDCVDIGLSLNIKQIIQFEWNHNSNPNGIWISSEWQKMFDV